MENKLKPESDLFRLNWKLSSQAGFLTYEECLCYLSLDLMTVTDVLFIFPDKRDSILNFNDAKNKIALFRSRQ